MQLGLGLMQRRGGSNAPNACMTEGTDGTKYGFLKGSFGTFVPPFSAEGKEVHEFTWQASGTFIMTFGAAGDEQLTGTNTVYVEIGNSTIELDWYSASNAYKGSNIEAATALMTDFVDGEERCSYICVGLPTLFIDYIFDTIPSYVKNEVSLVDPLYRGLVKSGRTLELSGDGKVDVPINATLGGEELCNTDFVELGCMTTLGTPVVTFANNVMTMESNGNNFSFTQQQITCEVGKTYTIEATLTNIDAGGANGALVHIRQSSDDTLIVSLSNTDAGTTKILRDTFVATETTMDVIFTAHTAADGQSASFTQPTVKEIQSTQGQITYYDATQKKYISIGESGTELVTNGDFSDGLAGWIAFGTNTGIEWLPTNRLKVTTTSITKGTSRTFPTVAGRKYNVSAESVVANKEHMIRCGDGNSPDAGIVTSSSAITPNIFNVSFKAISSLSYLYFRLFDIQAVEWDKYSIIEALPLSKHYQLKDITFNNLCVLWDRSFTQADRDLMDLDPTLLFQWAKGLYSGFSIGAKKPEDKVYMVTEDGAYLLEVDYSEGAELITNGTFDTDLSGWNNVNNWWQWSNGRASHPNGSDNNPLLQNINSTGLNILKFDAENTAGLLSQQWYPNGVGNQYIVLNGRNILFGEDIINNLQFKRSTTPANGYIDNVSVKPITSDYLPIQGTYTRLKNQQYGLQTLGLKLNDAGVPTALVDPNTLNFENDDGYVDTQWKPDLDEYTIEVMGSVDGVNFTKNTLTHDATGTLLYVDNVLLGSTQMPDPTTTFKLHKSDNFGPSVLKQHFRVWSKVVIY